MIMTLTGRGNANYNVFKWKIQKLSQKTDFNGRFELVYYS